MKNEEKTAVLNSLKIENDNKKKVDEEKPVSEEADADMSTTPKQTITDGDNVEIEYTKLSAEIEQL
jgi:DNA-directed RNA polymerase subunit H (RpoH/RPB5)